MSAALPFDPDRSQVHQRRLRPEDADRFRAHLMRLDAGARRLRFGGAVNERFLASYAERVLGEATVLGLFVDGKLRGAAELHVACGADQGEVAFSLETRLRGAGHGACLFESLRLAALRMGVETLAFQCLSENRAMLAVARRNGARLRFEAGEVHATLALPREPGRSPRPVELTAAAATRGLGSLRAHLAAGEPALG